MATLDGKPYEPETTAYVEGHIKSGDIFADVGAAIGWYSLIVSNLGAKSVALEPNVLELEILRKNVAYNHANVEIHPVAAGSSNEIKTFYTFSDFHAASTFLDPKKYSSADREASLLPSDDHEVHEQQVKVMRLDNLLPHADMVKIDTERFEMEVLKGMDRLLSESKPVLIIETDNPEVTRLLSGYGYKEAVTLDSMNKLYLHEAKL